MEAFLLSEAGSRRNSVSTTEIAEIDPGRLYQLGGTVRIDERISWRGPPDRGLYETINAYLLREGDEVLMIETGVAVHAEIVSAQLTELLGPGHSIKIAVTRNEPDCLSNIPFFAERAGVKLVYAPGIVNALDYFEVLSWSLLMQSYGVNHQPFRPGDRVALGPGRYIEAIATPLKMLSTAWYYDSGTRTLFTSDVMTDAVAPSPAKRTVREPVAFEPLVEDMKRHLVLRYDWLTRSDLRPIVRGLEKMFGSYAIDNIAPSRGCAIAGRPAAAQRLEALLQALRTMGAA